MRNRHDEEDDNQEPEPDENSITTENYWTFYQDGKVVLKRVIPERAENGNDWERKSASGGFYPLGKFGDDVHKAINAYLDHEQYWPNVFFISDHGNAQLITYWEN